eukprot:3709634-Alexandrium_andersonii.AAC.1
MPPTEFPSRAAAHDGQSCGPFWGTRRKPSHPTAAVKAQVQRGAYFRGSGVSVWPVAFAPPQ